MKIATAIVVTMSALLSSSVLVLADDPKSGGAPWGYREGDSQRVGPSKWATAYPTCGGSRQSPIDIDTPSCRGHKAKKVLPLQFSGQCSDFKIAPSVESYKAEVLSAGCKVSTKDKAFSLLQFHSHYPSEHTINGKAYDAEVHFVHQSDDASALLVVGVFLQQTPGVKSDAFFQTLWGTLDHLEMNQSVNTTLPAYAPLLQQQASKGRVFNYAGGLTSPPCNEIVDWWVLEAPLAVAPADFAKFQRHLKRLPGTDDGRGARPTQPLNGRSVTVFGQ